jgi:hypothetical protein
VEVTRPLFKRAGFFGVFLHLLGFPFLYGQTNPPIPAGEPPMTAEQLEFQKKLGAATAKAQQDPEVMQASRKAMKALRDADRMMYEKIRQFDPSLSEYVEQVLKMLPKETP